MELSRRSASLVALLGLAVGLGACATASPGGRGFGPRTSGVTIGAARWMGQVSDGDEEVVIAKPAAPANLALERSRPWLAGIGFQQVLADSAALGFGLALPKGSGSDGGSTAFSDIVRDAGIGLWLTLDF